jgi:hypothetical protein
VADRSTTTLLVLAGLAGMPSVALAQPAPEPPPPSPPVSTQESVPPPAPSASGKKPKKPEPAYPVFDVSARIQTGLEHQQTSPGEGQVEDDSRQPFFLDSARLELDMDLNDELSASFGAELTDEPVVRDAYVNVKLDKALQIRAGHFKRPISRTELTSIGRLPFRARGMGNQLLRDSDWAGRTIGVMVWGKLKRPKLQWSVAVMNAAQTIDVSHIDQIRGADLLARVEYEPLDWLEVAIHGGHKITEQFADGPNVQLSAVGGDVLLKVAALRIVLESTFGQNPRPPAPPSQQGRTPFAAYALAYATYDIALTDALVLQPVVVGEWADTDLDVSEDETLRAVLGVNLVAWQGLFRVLPQVELIRPLGDVSVRSQLETTTLYLLLSLQV